MIDKSVEIARSVPYRDPGLPRELANSQRPVWRIVHPEKTTIGRSYVGLVVATGPKPELALVFKGAEPPEEALQFCRQHDARLFAETFLTDDIVWQFEGSRCNAPPIWAEAEPLERTPEEYRDHPVRSTDINMACPFDVCGRPAVCRAKGCQGLSEVLAREGGQGR